MRDITPRRASGNSATIIYLPTALVRVERDENAWLVRCRQHGWLHSNRDAALADAHEIARGFGVKVIAEAHP
jgi:hypothetical protein